MSLEQIDQMMGTELKVSEKEVEQEDGSTQTVTCVDIRPMFEAMIKSGQMDEDAVRFHAGFHAENGGCHGRSMITASKAAYAASCDEAAGLNLAQIQTSYLWKKGLQMAGLAAIMMACAIFVSYLASKVGAGVGTFSARSLYEKVMHFSNAEMEHFSTASLITRSTNDVQADPDGDSNLSADACLRTDPWYRRYHQSNTDKIRHGLADRSGGHRDLCICHDPDECGTAEVQANAGKSGWCQSGFQRDSYRSSGYPCIPS